MIISAGKIASQEISDTIRANFHLLADTVSMGNPGASSLPDNEYKASVSPAKGFLGIEFTPTEKTFVDLAQQLIRLAKARRDAPWPGYSPFFSSSLIIFILLFHDRR
jgi:hypothetical protein